MGRPNQVQDRLDALLDGRPGEVTDDLAPLLAAAEALRAELADLELDPGVADRHLEQVLDRPVPVVTLPVRKAGGGLRRRVAAVALAAALVLVPATMASASALPGQGLYPVKLAVEQVRLAAVQWSPTLEAQERARLAAKRLEELDKLVKRRMFEQVPSAIRRLDQAVVAANAAVKEAVAEGADQAELMAVTAKLIAVAKAQHDELVDLKKMVSVLPADSRQAIVVAVKTSPADKVPISPPVLEPTPNPTEPPPQPTPTQPPPGPQPTPTEPPPGPQPTPPSTEPQQTTTTTPPTSTTTEAPPGLRGSEGGSTADGGSKETPGSSKSRSGTSKSGTSSSTGR
jgi:Domain of unknown function (DUF5667)